MDFWRIGHHADVRSSAHVPGEMPPGPVAFLVQVCLKSDWMYLGQSEILSKTSSFRREIMGFKWQIKVI